ncbi:MAG: T9SS type A sorting domain-containing protein, partial [Ginsengibacter sp.]
RTATSGGFSNTSIVIQLTVGVCTPPFALGPTGVIKSPDISSNENAKLNAYAIRNIEIRIKGNVGSGARAILYDMVGRIVLVRKLQKGNFNIIPTPGIKTAVYILSVIDHGKRQTFKIPLYE